MTIFMFKLKIAPEHSKKNSRVPSPNSKPQTLNPTPLTLKPKPRMEPHIGPPERTVLWSQEPNVLRFCLSASDLPILVVDHNPVPKTVPKPQQESERSHKVMEVEWVGFPNQALYSPVSWILRV